MSMAKKRKDRWIIVVNKKTYLFLAGAVCCLLYLIWDVVMIALSKKTGIDLLSDFLVCALISSVCIWFFVRFNSYSRWFNPDHPKPGDKK